MADGKNKEVGERERAGEKDTTYHGCGLQKEITVIID